MLECVTPITSIVEIKKNAKRKTKMTSRENKITFSIDASFRQLLLELFVDEMDYFCLQSPMLYLSTPKRSSIRDHVSLVVQSDTLDLIVSHEDVKYDVGKLVGFESLLELYSNISMQKDIQEEISNRNCF